MQCRSHTAWHRLLTAFGLIVGAGTALVVLAVIARVWWLPPPAAVRDVAMANDFAARVQQTADGALVRGVAPCRDAAGAAFCVQLAPAAAAVDRDALRARLESLLSAAPNLAPRRIVFVAARKVGDGFGDG